MDKKYLVRKILYKREEEDQAQQGCGASASGQVSASKSNQLFFNSHLGNHLPPLVDVLIALPSAVETLLDGQVPLPPLLRRPLLVLPLLRRLLQRRALTRRPALRRIHRFGSSRILFFFGG